ncbi:MAG: hypothetical protein GC139_10825 [Sideroxydans sp.]|nr:hypothetical protein [Sideroxydans sp.]
MNKKDEYVRQMHSRLDHLSAEIDVLSARAEQMAAESKSEYHRQIEVLRAKRDDARQHLDKLQKSGESAWEDMKAGLELAWEAIGEAVSSAKSRFK